MKIGNLEVYGIIYKITNKINGKVYIGQTKLSNGFNDRYNRRGSGIERVYKIHLYCKNNNVSYNRHLLRSIEKYGFDAFEVCEIFDVAFSKNELNIKEKSWISIYDSFNNGYNNTLGGEDTNGDIQKIPVIQLTLEGEYIKEWNGMSDITNELEISFKNISLCCNNQRKSAGGFMWIKKSEYEKEKIKPWEYDYRKREIVQLDLEGNFIKQWTRMTEAAEYITNNIDNKANIRACCVGKQKSAYGYMWMYLEDYYNNKDNITQIQRLFDGKSKNIIQLDLKNNFIREWESLSEADRQTGISFKNISACCRHKRQTTGGFKWMYAEEYYNSVNY